MRRSWINSRRDIGSPISARSAALAIATITAKKFFNADHIERVIAGFCAAQANTVLVGVPLLLQTFGEAGAMPLFLLLAVHLPLIATATALLIEGRSEVLRTLSRSLHNSILLAFFVGSSFRLSGLQAEGPSAAILSPLAGSATPCALIALGISLQPARARTQFGIGGNPHGPEAYSPSCRRLSVRL